MRLLAVTTLLTFSLSAVARQDAYAWDWAEHVWIDAGNVEEYPDSPAISVSHMFGEMYRVDISPPYANIFLVRSEVRLEDTLDFDPLTHCVSPSTSGVELEACDAAFSKNGIEYLGHLNARDLYAYTAIANQNGLEKWKKPTISFVAEKDELARSYVHSTIRPYGLDGGYYYTIDVGSFLTANKNSSARNK